MKKLAIVLMLFSCISYGYDKVCVDSDNTKCSQPITQGEVAPFSGQLLTPGLAIDLSQKADSFDTRINIEIERIKKLDALDLELEKKLHDLDKSSWVSEKELMMKSLSKLENPTPWYEKPIFVAIVSAVGVGLLSYGMYSIKK